jgi:hypothetical protein
MKPYQQYVFELNKVYEYKVKIAGTNPAGDVMERIKNALDAYQIESVSAAKSMPIQEHREFPKMGACECWIFEVSIKYPTTPEQLRQLIKERASINADCVCVWPKEQYEFNEEFEAHGKDHEGALLDQPDLTAADGGQELVGQTRRDSMLKELGARTYEFAAKSEADGKTMDTTPTASKSPVGSTQVKLPTPPKGSVR